jgi:hypothetical protein
VDNAAASINVDDRTDPLERNSISKEEAAMHLRVLQKAAAATIALLCLQGMVFAQAFGSITGSVHDERGDVVPGARVTITNTGTNATRSVAASKDGVFQFKQVPPGTYDVRAEASGFKTIVQTGVAVQVATPLSLDLEFTVGAVSETVEVVSGGETINREDATIGNTFSETQIRQLPIEGRNVVDLLSLQPGVTKTDPNDGHDDQRTGAVNGARGDQSNVTLDGVDVNDQQEGLAFTSVVPVTLDSVQEFRVTTANANADSGRGSGAQVALVTKSGTNDFHGSVYEFHRNTVTTANTYFNNLSGVERPKLLRNVFGFSFGGPFIKDKFFFFVNYEGRRDAREDSVLRIVPTDTLRAGIVRYQNTNGGVTTLTPDDLQAIDAAGIGVSPVALSILQSYPHANDVTAGDGLNTAGFRFKAPVAVKNNTYIARADYHINDNNLVFWRGNLADNLADDVPQFPGDPPRFTTIDNSRGYAVGLTSLLSSNWTNVFRYGLSRQGNENAGALSSALLGFRGIDYLGGDDTTYSSARIIPTHNITDDATWVRGNHTVGFGTNLRFIRFHTTSYEHSFPLARANSSWLDATGEELTPDDLDPNFEVAYIDATIAALGLLDYALVTYNYDREGNALPIGAPVKRDFAANEYEFYVQDTWKIRPNLTLTGGLRYSLFSPPWETNGLQVAPTIPLGEWYQLRIDNAAQGIPSNAAPNITFDLAGPANDRPGYYDWDKNNFAPRVSVAWAPAYENGFWAKVFGGPDKSSVRAGFGVFYEHIGAGLANRFDRDGSVGLSTALENPAGGYDVASSPRYTSTRGLPPLPAAPPGGFPASLEPGTQAITFGLDSNIITPIDYTFDVSFSRDIGWDVVLETAYVGRFARHRLAQSDLAQPLNFRDPVSGQDWYTVAGIFADWIAQGRSKEDVPKIPYIENLYPDLAANGLTSTQRAYRLAKFLAPDWTFVQYYLDQYFPPKSGPYIYFDDQYTALGAWRSDEDTNYNALQLMLRKRFSHGLTFDVNYTYSKSIDLTSETERTEQYGSDFNTTGFIINGFDHNQNRAVSDFDTTHQINANWLWEIPVGHDRQFLNDSPGWVDQVVGGWQLTGIVRATSGFPVSVQNGRIWPTNWNISGWATPTGNIRGNTTQLPDGPNLFDNPNLAIQSFQNSRAGQSGGRNVLRGDGFFTLDFGLGKTFRLPWEGHKLQFRWEVFNATNTARFDVSTISLDITNSGTFGRYQDTLSPPRVMQFGLRYEF